MRQTNIHKGAFGEGKFIAKCLENGLNLSLPIRPTAYDFIVDNGQKLVRVQVKSVSRIDTSSRGEKVKCMLTHGSVNGKRGYTKEMVDFIVLYVVPLEEWYLFPIEAVESKLTISLFPTVKNSTSKYEEFRNNWNLLN